MNEVDPRNPTGIVRTQQEIDESTRQTYWIHAAEYGLQYYVTGRFAVASRFTPIGPSLLHHAVEMLLKACLAYNDSVETIKSYGHKRSYRHSLVKLWEEFRRRNVNIDTTEFDGVIYRLDAFDHIRYPDNLVTEGAYLQVGMFEVEQPTAPPETPERSEPTYTLMLPQIDRLIRLLFEHTHFNPPAVQSLFSSEHAIAFFRLHNLASLEGVVPLGKLLIPQE
jgi:hypothetical protein